MYVYIYMYMCVRAYCGRGAAPSELPYRYLEVLLEEVPDALEHVPHLALTVGMGVKGVDGWHDAVEFQSAFGYIATLPGGLDEFLGRPFPQVLFAHYAQWFFAVTPVIVMIVGKSLNRF